MGPGVNVYQMHLQVLEDHSRPVLSLAIADKKLFSGSYDYTIKVWSLDTLQRLKTLTGGGPRPAPCSILAERRSLSMWALVCGAS